MMENSLAFEMLESDIGRVRQPVLIIADHDTMADQPDNSALKAIAQGAHARQLVVHMSKRQLGRLSEPDDGGRVFRAAAPPPFLRSTPDQGTEGRTLAQIERPDAFGTVQLVSR